MIAFGLLGVVVDEFPDVGLYELNLGKNVVGGGCPCEWLGVGVPVLDVVANLLDQNGDRGEGAAPDGLAGDDAEPGLDLVDPGRTDLWGEVEVHVRVALEPRLDLGGGVGGQVCPARRAHRHQRAA